VVTLYDVARLAGVSTATVSRVIHGQDRVRDTTRARVQQVIDQLGYVPNGAAQSLSRRQKNVIGLVCFERQWPTEQDAIENMSLLFYDEILRGVEARIRDNNWSLLITYVGEAVGPELPRLLALSGQVDGLLIGEEIMPRQFITRLAGRLPVVVVAGSPGERVADVVAADNRAGSAALAAHLINDHGKRRLYYVDGPPSAADARERRAALSDQVAATSGCQLVGSTRGYFTVRSGEEAAADILATCGDALPDAVVCANDEMAFGVLRAFAAAAVRVPEQVAVVGFDDMFPASLYDPPLTTVHQPMRLIGERACTLLLDRIARPDLPPRVELLPTELVLRSSCGCPAGTVTRRPVPALRDSHASLLSSRSPGRDRQTIAGN
jgi:LacI family transcriptional regulator